MNTLPDLATDITKKRGLILILTTDGARKIKTRLLTSLILCSPIFVVAASEWLPAYELTRSLRKETLEVRQSLNRLHTVRASTCYRLLDSLANTPSNGEPILILDFLHTFYDADVPLRSRFHTLRECCRQLKRLALYRPVIAMTQELPVGDYEKFSPALHSIADKILTLDPELEQIKQPALF